MSREKKIEEMAEGILEEFASSYSQVDKERLVKMLYNAGCFKRSEWISVKERLPEDDYFVPVIVSGKYRNIVFENGVEIASYVPGEGWIVEAYPNADLEVSFWMPIPDVPVMNR